MSVDFPMIDGKSYCPVLPRKRKPLKVPKYTMAPIRDWTETAGLRRAVAVLKTEAAVLKREGYDLQPKALLKVAAALTEANRKGSTTGEAYALDWLRRESDLHEVLGKEFITVYAEIKELEFDEFMKVISPWEREHLLLHV